MGLDMVLDRTIQNLYKPNAYDCIVNTIQHGIGHGIRQNYTTPIQTHACDCIVNTIQHGIGHGIRQNYTKPIQTQCI